MKNLTKILQKDIFPVSLILLLAFSRLLPHPPNFTPIVAVAIMSGYFFKNINLSVVVTVVTLEYVVVPCTVRLPDITRELNVTESVVPTGCPI